MAETYYFFTPFQGQSEWTLASAFILALISFLWLIYTGAFKKVRKVQQVLIVGSSELGKIIAQEILSNPKSEYSLLGVIVEPSVNGYSDQIDRFKTSKKGSVKVLPVPTIGRTTEFDQIIRETKVNQIVVALADQRRVFPLETLLECKLKGIKIWEAVDFYEKLTGKVVVHGLRPSWLIFCQGFNKSKFNEARKRAFDLGLSTLGLILAAPLMLVTAALIRLESRGPVIFKQERVGQGGKVFELYKFRSMTTNAEAGTGPVWAKDSDPRITRIGRIIRRFRIDELPQLMNILKGEMSFVGPRPERPYFVEDLKKQIPYYTVRLSVKPGLTGWAQVNFHYGASVEDAVEKLQYDIFYIKNSSLLLDLRIIFKTVGVILSGKGAK